MPFHKVKPQKVRHSDGYIVQSCGRYHVEYFDKKYHVIVEVDHALESVGIKKKSILFYSLENEYLLEVSEGTKKEILSKISDGIVALNDFKKTIEYY